RPRIVLYLLLQALRSSAGCWPRRHRSSPRHRQTLEAGVVVPRPTVTPVASLAGKSTAPPMRVPAMRSRTTDTSGGGGVLEGTSELLGTVVFGGYPSSPLAIRCAPGGATALRRRPSKQGRRGRGVATMATIVATSGPPHQVRGARSDGRRRNFFFSG